MLIHTGATVTLISNDLFTKMENPLITTMNREILSANGSVLQVTGKTTTFRNVYDAVLASLEVQTYDSINVYVCYNDHVGVYTSIDLYVNNGFPCNLQC
jgi:hypothetical protein